jgi:hypothetical protein
MALGVLAVGVLAIRFAQPILDGDLFWQMKYGQQLLARHTLIPDHTLYSWTPTTNATIYCAWISELLLYGLYRLGGLPILFALRYLVVAACGGLMLLFARRLKALSDPGVPAIVLLALICGIAGTLIKPELFSFLAFHLVVFAYAGARAVDRGGGDARPWLFAVPLVVLVWANAHGGFILAAPFFAVTATAELGLRWLVPSQALSPRARWSLLAAWALSAAAVFATPYGWRYPAQLAQDYLLHTGPRVGENWNNAYQSILAQHDLNALVVCGLLMAAALGALAFAARRGLNSRDWGLLLAVVAYVPLYLLYIRSTFYLAVVFGYAALDLLAAAHPRESEARRLGAMALAAAVAVTALVSARQAEKGSWIGFGVSYTNPVPEAEFLAASRLGPRLYNTFDSGGYLIWRLDPRDTVMIDPRFFPYKDEFPELQAFSNGQDVDAFTATYPGDAAIIDIDRVAVWRNFVQSKAWKLVYYGPTSAVFAPAATPPSALAQSVASDRFDRLRNGQTALFVYDFAIANGDYATAWKVLAELDHGLGHQVPATDLARAEAVREGYRRVLAGDDEGAEPYFATAASRRLQGWREVVILNTLRARATALAAGDAPEAARQEAALKGVLQGVPAP